MICKICNKHFSTSAGSPICPSCDRAAQQLAPHTDVTRLKELADADQLKRINILPFTPGSSVWVVERDEDGNACDYSGFCFIGIAGAYVIVSPSVYGLDTFDELMEYHSDQTAQEAFVDLSVYPLRDCYQFKQQAKDAFKAEARDNE